METDLWFWKQISKSKAWNIKFLYFSFLFVCFPQINCFNKKGEDYLMVVKPKNSAVMYYITSIANRCHHFYLSPPLTSSCDKRLIVVTKGVSFNLFFCRIIISYILPTLSSNSTKKGKLFLSLDSPILKTFSNKTLSNVKMLIL